jgi:hypothetical protein
VEVPVVFPRVHVSVVRLLLLRISIRIEKEEPHLILVDAVYGSNRKRRNGKRNSSGLPVYVGKASTAEGGAAASALPRSIVAVLAEQPEAHKNENYDK